MQIRMSVASEAVEIVRARFASEQIDVEDIEARTYPDEVVVVVRVNEDDFHRAALTGNLLDGILGSEGLDAFVTVRSVKGQTVGPVGTVKEGVHDPRATALQQLLRTRAKTSASQPSLSYVQNAAASVVVFGAYRHHLLFGRRGVGKTALMLEARKRADLDGNDSVWINLQTYRRESAPRAFLWIVQSTLDQLVAGNRDRPVRPGLDTEVATLMERIAALLAAEEATQSAVERLVPDVHRALSRHVETWANHLFLFLDDFYYLSRMDQPYVLDLLHGCTRDINVWMKVASIQHLTRWFQASPPVGLQSGQDADIINLDVTLQEPERASEFLEQVLGEFCREVTISRSTAVVSQAALDRLVFASGGVPRDYLRLCADAIVKAQGRVGARLAGVQDVNQAAGDMGILKLRELEEDSSANIGDAEMTLSAFNSLKTFCLDEVNCTYYRVDVRDKEATPEAYASLVAVTEQRLNHLIDPSVSDAHKVGERYEVYMLDLSQYSGYRLKQGVRVLDFSKGHLLSRKTRSGEPSRIGVEPRDVTAILRTAPLLELSRLQAN